MEPLKVEVREEIVCPEGYEFVRNGRASHEDLMSVGGVWVTTKGVLGFECGPDGRLLYFVSSGTDYYIIRRKPDPVGPQGDGVEWVVRGELAECKAKLSECEKKLAECRSKLALHMDALQWQKEQRAADLGKITSLERRLREAAEERDKHADVSLKYMKAISAAGHTLNEALGLKVTT